MRKTIKTNKINRFKLFNKRKDKTVLIGNSAALRWRKPSTSIEGLQRPDFIDPKVAPYCNVFRVEDSDDKHEPSSESDVKDFQCLSSRSDDFVIDEGGEDQVQL